MIKFECNEIILFKTEIFKRTCSKFFYLIVQIYISFFFIIIFSVLFYNTLDNILIDRVYFVKRS